MRWNQPSADAMATHKRIIVLGMSGYRFAPITALVFVAFMSASAQTTWNRVSSFKFNWDGQASVQVILEIPDPWRGPGDFTRIRIRVPGKKEFTLSNKNDWVKYASEKVSRTLIARNVVRSPYVLALKIAENRTALFLLGYGYASSPGSLDVLELSQDGQPRVVLHRKELGLQDVRDLDGDGIAEVVGYPCLSQEFGNGLLTYDPYNVYRLGKTSATPAGLSLPLTKAYNLRHYYGWAGAQCSEDIAIVLHPPKGHKPLVMSTREAEKLMSEK